MEVNHGGTQPPWKERASHITAAGLRVVMEPDGCRKTELFTQTGPCSRTVSVEGKNTERLFPLLRSWRSASIFRGAEVSVGTIGKIGGIGKA